MRTALALAVTALGYVCIGCVSGSHVVVASEKDVAPLVVAYFERPGGYHPNAFCRFILTTEPWEQALGMVAAEREELRRNLHLRIGLVERDKEVCVWVVSKASASLLTDWLYASELTWDRGAPDWAGMDVLQDGLCVISPRGNRSMSVYLWGPRGPRPEGLPPLEDVLPAMAKRNDKFNILVRKLRECAASNAEAQVTIRLER